MNEIKENEILKFIREVQILLVFQRFTEKVRTDLSLRQTYIDLIKKNGSVAVRNIFRDRFDYVLDDSEAEYMLQLINAFFRKGSTRKKIPDEERKKLLVNQSYRCAFCGKPVDMSSPIDHIVPFKYVGDELDNNYQVLCDKCNSEKNQKLTYQIEIILKGGNKIC